MLSGWAMRPVPRPNATYRRHQPEQTVLYRTIAAHLSTFLARTAAEVGTGGWPAFVRREFEAYLRCGILRHGLLRVRCERCGETTVVAFSCPEFLGQCPQRRLLRSRPRRPPPSPYLLLKQPPLGGRFADELGRLQGEAKDHGSTAQRRTATSQRSKGLLGATETL